MVGAVGIEPTMFTARVTDFKSVVSQPSCTTHPNLVCRREEQTICISAVCWGCYLVSSYFFPDLHRKDFIYIDLEVN